MITNAYKVVETQNWQFINLTIWIQQRLYLRSDYVASEAIKYNISVITYLVWLKYTYSYNHVTV